MKTDPLSVRLKRHVKQTIFAFLSSFFELFIVFFLSIIAILSRFIIKVSKKSIFMGMMHINNWAFVANALRKRGYDVQVIPWQIPTHEVGIIPYDINLKEEYPLLYSNFPGQYILQIWIFCWALFNFNIFITPFRTRILDRSVWLSRFEIPLLHLAGKKVILNTYGADVATPRLTHQKKQGYSLYNGYIKDPQYQGFDERKIAKNTRLLERQADCIISAIDHVDYLQRVDHYFHLRCIDTNEIKPSYYIEEKCPVFIHAPNHRLLKGTDRIIEVIKKLNDRGFPCKLKIIENTPHDQLLDKIRDADAVIDQLILGTYARLSIEAMTLGKPVFCYLRQDLFQYNPIWENCPIINVDPDILEKKLEQYLKMTKYERLGLAEASRQYVENFHSLDVVGRRADEIIKGVISQ